jgi:hypothetical protein
MQSRWIFVARAAVLATVAAVALGVIVASVTGGVLWTVLPNYEGARLEWEIDDFTAQVVASGFWILVGAGLYYSLPTLVYMLTFGIAATRRPTLRTGLMIAVATVVGSVWVLLAVQLVVGGGDWDKRTAVAVVGTIVGIGSGLALISRALTRRERAQVG